MSDTYDLSLLKSDVVLGGFIPEGEVLTGPLKVCQKFVALFLTEKGSQALDLDYGCEFVTHMRQNQIRTETDVSMYFNQAISDILSYLRAELTGDEPANETIVSITLDHFELAPPNLMLYSILLTRDGTSQEVVFPVNTVEGA